jgi:hypothetical protein
VAAISAVALVWVTDGFRMRALVAFPIVLFTANMLVGSFTISRGNEDLNRVWNIVLVVILVALYRLALPSAVQPYLDTLTRPFRWLISNTRRSAGHL